MLNYFKRHKIILIPIIVDLVFTWLMVYSGIVLPYINPTVEQYRASATSFPRDYNQLLIWYLLHIPSSGFIEDIFNGVHKAGGFIFLSVIQTGLIAYLIEKRVKR